jgi:hypothetical protein
MDLTRDCAARAEDESEEEVDSIGAAEVAQEMIYGRAMMKRTTKDA